MQEKIKKNKEKIKKSNDFFYLENTIIYTL